jgi:hypothetical protein
VSRAVSPWSNRPTELELAVFELAWRCYRNGETDLLGGGVAPATIARETDSRRAEVSDVCRRLRDEGLFVAFDGANPENYRPRESFAPAALVEDDGGEGR